MKLSSFETITNEHKFLEVNEARSKGPPECQETKAAIRRLEKYKVAKEHENSNIPIDIIQSINITIQDHGIQSKKD